MARQRFNTVENSFIRGRITEATGLNFPENAVTDEENCVFDKTGAVRRRLGVDLEDSYSTLDLDPVSTLKEYYWRTVAGIGTLSFVVVQYDNLIHFYNASVEGALSDNKKSFSIDLDSYRVAGAPTTEEVACEFTSGLGKLFISHAYCDPLAVEYDADTDTISVESIVIYTRDFEGVEDGLDIDERPATLSTEHRYNLYNQGWYHYGVRSFDLEEDNQNFTGGPVGNMIDNFYHFRGITNWFYPANSDIWWVFKDSQERFSGQSVNKFPLTNTPAPKGHYILEEFRKNRNVTPPNATYVVGLPLQTSGYYRPSVIAFFAGRVFYAGVNENNYSSNIYFSKIIEDEEDYGKCYQINDPTGEINVDLLPSDGGVITIPEAGIVYKLFPIENALIVFASNGIWAITGSEGIGFTATDFTIRSVSSVNSLSSNSFVDLDGSPCWWSESGIFVLGSSDQLGNLSLQSLTDSTIKEYIAEFPTDSKLYVKGAYNRDRKIVQWLIRSSAPETVTDRYQYDTILNFSLESGAFYTWTFDTSEVNIHGIVTPSGYARNFGEEDVVDESDIVVTDESLVPVTVQVSFDVLTSSVFRYLVSVPTAGSTRGQTFAAATDSNYVDWYRLDSEGVDFESFFVTGYKIPGEAQRKFQPTFITVFFDTEPSSSCYMKGIWDWHTTDVPDSRHTTKQQVYKATSNTVISSKRLKLRGHGRVLQMKFSSQQGRPFKIVGWATTETINAAV